MKAAGFPGDTLPSRQASGRSCAGRLLIRVEERLVSTLSDSIAVYRRSDRQRAAGGEQALAALSPVRLATISWRRVADRADLALGLLSSSRSSATGTRRLRACWLGPVRPARTPAGLVGGSASLQGRARWRRSRNVSHAVGMLVSVFTGSPLPAPLLNALLFFRPPGGGVRHSSAKVENSRAIALRCQACCGDSVPRAYGVQRNRPQL